MADYDQNAFREEPHKTEMLDPNSVNRKGLSMGRERNEWDNSFAVVVVNRSNLLITAWLDASGNAHPCLIGRTCNSSYDVCVSNMQYASLCTCKCNDAPFQIGIRYLHPNGGTRDTPYYTICPDCKFVGAVIDFNMPDLILTNHEIAGRTANKQLLSEERGEEALLTEEELKAVLTSGPQNVSWINLGHGFLVLTLDANGNAVGVTFVPQS